MPPAHLIAASPTQVPPLAGHQFFSTDLGVVPITLLVLALVLYFFGVRRANQLHPRHPWSGWRTAAWTAATVITAIATLSFIGVYDDVLFYDHMIQHLLLIMVAGALFALGAPCRLALWATTGRAHAVVMRALRSAPSRLAGNPFVAFLIYAIIIPLTHLTAFYNFTLEYESVHDLEHVVYLVVGYLFWRQVFPGEPTGRKRLYPALRLAYLAAAVPIDTFTGLSLAATGHELFPAYVRQHRTWGPSLVLDLHIGGTIMWVGGDTLMLLAMIPVVLEWVRYEERRAVRADRELDALVPEPAVSHDVEPARQSVPVAHRRAASPPP